MDNKKNGIPKLRFPGFTGAWEQRKLGEVIVSEHKGKVKSSMKGGNTNYLETNYLNGGIAQKVNATADVSKNDVLILWDGSKAGTVYHGFEGALGSTLKVYVPKCSGDFLYQILKKDQDKIYQRYRTPNIPHVIKNFTEKFIVSIPNVREQEKIAEFFHDLDSLIALHQRKLEHLQEQKKGLLQKMFPKNGETVPEVRFPGFTDAWEQRKLGEILKERKERSSIGELISVTINNGVVKADSLERKDNSSSDKSNYKVVCKGDIAYNSMRMWQGASGYSPYNGILSPAYTVLIPTEKVDSKFISYMFKKEKMLQQFQKYSQGLTSDTWNLKYPMLKDIPVLFPKIDEQVSIRKHLDNISSLIALHQRKLEHLELMKKGLLQQMFV